MDEDLIKIATDNVVELEPEDVVESTVNAEDMNHTITQEEEIKVIEIETVEEIEIDMDESVGWVGGDCTRHYSLAGRDESDQHPITAITGLRTELDNIEKLQTVYSDKKQQADYYMWRQDDKHPLPTNPYGLFVSICPNTDTIQTCDDTHDVFGVTVEDAAFVGGQEYAQADGGVKTGRDGHYCLVVHSGLVAVRRVSSVAVGDYVVPNSRGEAKKSDGNYGYLVTALSEVNGVQYAIVSLNAASALAQTIADNVDDLSKRMRTAEYNITSVTNVANSAYALAKDAKENAEVNSEYLEEKIEEVLGRMDAVDGVVGNLNESFNNASANAALAKAIAEGAVSSAEAIRDEAVATANEAVANVKDLTDDLAPITEWVDPSNPDNIGAQYYTAYIENGINTKVDIETFDSKTEEAFNAIERNAKSIASLVATIDKYSVGEYSQAYGLTIEQAISTLSNGMVYVPTVVHTESYGSYAQEFSLGYYYTWNGEKWTPSQSTAVSFSGEYLTGTAQTPYWVVTVADVVRNSVTYDLGGLYKWENVSWVKVASIADNVLSRAVSAIKVTTNSIETSVTAIDDKYAGTKTWIDNNKASIQDTVTWHSNNGDSLVTFMQEAGENFASASQVAQIVDKDGNIKAASITTAVVGDESSIGLLADNITLDADQINFISQEFNIYPSDGNGNKTSNKPNFSVDKVGNVTFNGAISNGKFEVTKDGDLTSTSGRIGGFTIGETDLTSGGVGMSSDTTDGAYAFWAGNENPENAPFSVTNKGSIIANEGMIGQCAIKNGEMKAKHLSSISADLGEITAGSIESPNYKDRYNIIVWTEETESVSEEEVTTVSEEASTTSEEVGVISETASEGLEFTLSTDGSFYILVGIGTCTDTNVIIPSTYNGLPVASIGYNAFYGCTSLTSITVPNSVTAISEGAFGCAGLESITLPFVGSSANSTEPSSGTLFGVVFGRGSYDGGAATQQYYSPMSNVYKYYIPTSLKSVTITGGNIFWGAFHNCSNLMSVVLPYGLIRVEDRAFYNCSSLTNVIMSDGVKYIGANAFCNCRSLTSIEIPNSVTNITNYAFYQCTSLTKIELPDNLESIGDYAFSYCRSLTSIEIPNSVTRTGFGVFEYCSSLTSVVIGNGVIAIGHTAFGNCSNLKNVYYNGDIKGWCGISFGSDDANPLFYAGNLYINDELVTDISIPFDIHFIKNYAFYNCSNLASVIIPYSVQSIGDSAFYNCSNLETIYYGDTSDMWSSMIIKDGNESLESATIYYHSSKEPTEDGDYWHYGNGFKIMCDDDTMIDSSYFKVTSSGLITAVDANFGGTINASTITIGNGFSGQINTTGTGVIVRKDGMIIKNTVENPTSGVAYTASMLASIGTDGSLSMVLGGTWVGSSGVTITSDKNLKHDIEELKEEYNTLFDYLQPKRFKYNDGTSDRYHTGFIAQELEDAINKANLSTQEVGCFVRIGDNYGIRYDEIIALCVDQIQKLKKQVEELKTTQNDLKEKLDGTETEGARSENE